MDTDLRDRDSGSTQAGSTASPLGESSPTEPPSYFQRIRDALTEKTFCSGAYQVSTEECILFYGKEKGATSRIDLSAATEDELNDLARLCDPATFGQGQTDVLDETYRKAKKLDTSDFSSKFNVHNTGLINIIRSELLEGEDHLKTIHAELYKLNIYDQGAFFKAHKDTPRLETMFGSLVIVFPTPHEGGALVLRHAGKEWSFDSAKAISDQSAPSIAYIAFFSDVEHEVALVTSGYRVTLTYNLYFSANDGAIRDLVAPTVHPSEESIKTTISQLLAKVGYLPDGGKLGFGLSHEYPLSSQSIDKKIIHRLKGSDALIFRVCQQLSLKAEIRVLYKGQKGYILCPNVVTVHDHVQVEDLDGYLIHHGRGVRVIAPGDKKVRNSTIVQWVTKKGTYNTYKPAYIAYGNEALLTYMYAQLVLIVKIGPSAKRATIVKKPIATK